jgi:hypothetical protein
MDSYERKRKQHGGFAINTAYDGSAIATTALKTVRGANHTIYVQKIVLSITTHVDGKIFSIQDDNSSPKIIAYKLDDAEADGTYGNDVIVWDFGSEGMPLTAGKSLHHLANTSGSGFVGVAHIEGYEKLTSVINLSTTPALS